MNNWYAMDTEAVLAGQKADARTGLSSHDLAVRRTQFGFNKFDEKKKEGLAAAILRQLRDISVIVLLVAAGLSFAMALRDGHGFIEPIVIISIVIMNVILAISQERSAEKALEALAVLNSPNCFVIREGVKTQIDTVELVPGDIIVIKTGDLVPADARLLEAESLAVDESSLTGESEAREKITDTIDLEHAPLG
ncbi:MAG: HAD-IC family P-type ATPase, partial [Treponema sp.]|nr:HAD-IC family P-type ATPase [Treponema sp.]